MRLMPYTSFLVGVLSTLVLLGSNERLFAQNNGNVQKVRIETDDGVELQGYWYPSGQRNAPTVLLLHALGQEISKREWKDLATALQKEGYAVLGFDFRGHGGSTSLKNAQRFWALNPAGLIKKGANANTIEYKNFALNYLPYLVNDIAAAKAFLDMKNEAQECNSSALIVIGAETGATLGAIWMNSECYRMRLIPAQPPVNPFPRPDTKNPACDNIGAAIFLSISPNLGGNREYVSSALRVPVLGRATPSVFFYNDNNEKEKNLAKKLGQNLKEKGDRHKFIGSSMVKDAQDLTGRELLQEGLKTQQGILKYLDTLDQQGKFNPWTSHDLKNTQYIWYFGNRPQLWVPANTLGDTTFRFYPYAKFIP